jgi:hypothetical protein
MSHQQRIGEESVRTTEVLKIIAGFLSVQTNDGKHRRVRKRIQAGIGWLVANRETAGVGPDWKRDCESISSPHWLFLFSALARQRLGPTSRYHIPRRVDPVSDRFYVG